MPDAPIPPEPAPGAALPALRGWVVGAAVLWGGLAWAALFGAFTDLSLPWRYALLTASTAAESMLFVAAARRRDLGPRLQVALRWIAASFLLSCATYVQAWLVSLGWVPASPPALDAVLTFLTYGLGVVGLLWWPLAPLTRARWWHFGLDATIGTAGMALFFTAIATLPGAATRPEEAAFLVSLGAALFMDVVAINVVLVRGLPVPTRRAFRTYMAALLLEVVSLVLIQYFTATLPEGRVSALDDAVYLWVQGLYVCAALFLWRDPPVEPAVEPLPSWMLTFNPLPLLAILGVAALFLSDLTRGDGPLEDVLALGLVALVALQTIRLLATVWENLRLVREGQALQAEKLDALRRIAGGISHEFNNMLTAVIGHAELGLSEVEPSSRVGRDLEGIRAAAERASVLTRELLAYSGGQFTGRQRLDFAAALRQVGPAVRQAAGSRVTVIAELPPGPAWVTGDAAQLAEMVLALARHAARRLTTGGTLHLALQSARLETPLEAAAGVLPPGEYLRLTVADTGPVVPPPALDRIFEPFAAAAAADGGVPALGLAAVQGVVTAHGGGIVAASDPGQGLVLTVYLPVAPGP